MILFEYDVTLEKQWDYTKNTLDPSKITHASNKKAWWLCDKGHSWYAMISSRSKGYGCPACYGRVPVPGETDLKTVNPVLAKELDDTRYNATELLPKSNKKVWWKCKLGHRWETAVATRSSGTGCPICSNKQILVGYNDLETTNPQLASEMFDDVLSSRDVTEHSNRKVGWKCTVGHIWKATVGHRARKNYASNCPICTNRTVLAGFNDLLTTNPELAAELHDDLVKPTEVTWGSAKVVRWRCHNGHVWRTTIASRSSGNGCALCSETNTSSIERRLEASVREKTLIACVESDSRHILNISWRTKNHLIVDILAEYKGKLIVIEYDGHYWHNDRLEVDVDKTQALLSEGFTVIRVRDSRIGRLPLEHKNYLEILLPYTRNDLALDRVAVEIESWLDSV